MPERKLVKHGPSTFMVSLPKRWVDRHQFSKGDSIKYEEESDSITFFAGEFTRQDKTVTHDVSGLDRTSILYILRGLYRRGFAEITLRFNKPTVVHHRLDKEDRIVNIVSHEVQRLIGVEVATYHKDSIVIKQMAEPTQDQFESSLRRIFLQMRMMMNELVEDIHAEELSGLEDVKVKQDSITKVVSFCLRILSNERRWENTPYLTTTLMELETLNNLIYYFARHVKEEDSKVDKSTKEVLKYIADLQHILEQMYYRWDNEKANEFNRLRNKIGEKMKLGNPKDTYLTYFLQPIVTIQRSIQQSRLSMNEDLIS